MNHRWTLKHDELVCSDANGVFTYPDADTVYRVFIENESLSHFPPKSESTFQDLSFSSSPVDLQVALVHRRNDSRHIFTLKCFVCIESKKIPVENFFNRKTDHIIHDKKWYPFFPEALSDVIATLKTAGVSNLENLKLRDVIAIKKIALADTHFTDETGSIGSAVFGYADDNDPAENPNVNATLYPYQLQGWKWLRYIANQGLGAILADEMGLGKTLQIISFLSSEKIEKPFPTLIIAPSTLLENWRREIFRFAPWLSVKIHQGNSRTGSIKDLIKDNIIVTSYDTVVRDYSLFSQITWKVMILDEAQAIKNPDAKRTKTIKKFKRGSALAVTGTPVENQLRDLWSIFDFVLPDYLGKLPAFEKNFENSADGALKLEPYVRPLLLRRKVSEVAKDLPPRIDIPQALTMPHEEAVAYEAIRTQAKLEFEKNATLASLVRLRQFCSHPFLINPSDSDPALASEKYRRLLEILEEVFQNGQKVLVFTSFHEMSDILKRDIPLRFDVYGNGIDGRTPVPERQAIVDEFSNCRKPAFLALNPKAAGAGLNITSANHVVHYNLEWNPAVEDQASARAHRRGQTLPVTVHRLFYANTVEESVDERLSRKRNIAGNVIVGVEGKDQDYQDLNRALAVSPLQGDR